MIVHSSLFRFDINFDTINFASLAGAHWKGIALKLNFTIEVIRDNDDNNS